MANAEKAVIAFGLVQIPVRLRLAAKSLKEDFHLLHSPCGTPVRLGMYCHQCARPIARGETVRALGENGERVTFTAQELARIEAAGKTKEAPLLKIETVVEPAEIDPILVRSSYLAEPAEGARKGFALLAATLAAEKKAAVGSLGLRRREHLMAVRSYRGSLALHSLYYGEELRAPACAETAAQSAEVAMARRLLAAYPREFRHESYSDGRKKALEQLIAGKTGRAAYHDLAEALQASIAQAEKAQAEKAAAKTSSAGTGDIEI